MASPLTHQSLPISLPISITSPLFFPCVKLLDEPSFTSIEKEQIKRFQLEVQRRIHQTGSDLSYLTMFAITQSCDIDTSMTAKDGLFMVALWVTLLIELSRIIPMEMLKYSTFEAFHNVYSGKFDHESIDEQHYLWHTANWMSILFQMIPAKKNKGLAMQVIPKLIEGWDAKYVTGSGQTKFTAYRVFLFESEGNTKASHRGRTRGSGPGNSAHGKGTTKGKKRSVGSGRPPKARRERSGSGDVDFHPAKRRKRRATPAAAATSKKSVSFSSSTSTIMMGENEVMEADGRIYVYNYLTDRDHEEDDAVHEDGDFSEDEDEEEAENSLDSFVDSFGETDGDDQSVNADVHTVFKAFKTLPPMPPGLNREETTSLSIPMAAELMRSDSLLNLKKPSLDRDVSWNEIPVNQSSITTSQGMKRSTSCNTILSAAANMDFDNVFDNVLGGMYSHMPSPMLVHSGLSSPHMIYPLPGPSPVPFGPSATTTVSTSNNSSNNVVNWWSTLQ